MGIVNEHLARYMETLLPAQSPALEKLAEEGKTKGIPLLHPSSVQFIRVLLSLLQPRSILEIGTAIGYSAIHMAEAAPNAKITTLEMNPERAKEAQRHFEEAGMAGRIEVVVGDAKETMGSLSGPFDFLFIDAAKGEYPEYLRKGLPLLSQGGVIVSDNVFFRGMTAEAPEHWDPKYRNAAGAMVRYNSLLAGHPDLETAFIPVGDGMALSYKKR